MKKFLKNILLGKKYLDEQEIVERFGTDAEKAEFYRYHKPLWKELLCDVCYLLGCAVLVGMVVFTAYVMCACTDYNWVPVK